MLYKLRFLTGYFLYFLGLFEAARLIFIFFNRVFIIHQQVFFSMWYGLRMDVSMTAYFMLPVLMYLLINTITGSVYRSSFLKLYSALIISICIFLFVADIGLFKAWGFRLDVTPLKYIGHPKEMWASISHLPVFWILLAVLLLIFILIKLNFKFIHASVQYMNLKHDRRWVEVMLLLILTALMIIPMRGGFQLAPLNQSGVYFSTDNFSNQAAINPVWNVMYSLNHHVESTENPYQAGTSAEAEIFTKDLFTNAPRHRQLIDLSLHPNPNVLVVIWESFTAKIIDQKQNGIEITPGFNKLKQEGIYFSDLYATGDRTDKGIVALLSGYPAQPSTSIVKTPGKAAKLPMLSKIFSKQNYHTAFYYGGEPEFANMKAYLLQGGFKKFVTKDDFPSAQQNSKWGAHDDVVMKKMFSDIGNMPQPFFTTWLTLSSHEPFETPVKKVIEGNDDESLFLNAMHYTDATIYELVEQCKKQDWWNNTIMVIVPDHGSRLPAAKIKSEDFKISMLLLGGALNGSAMHIQHTGSQIDLPVTLLNQLNLPSGSFRWSKDLLDSSARNWGYFAFNNGFGFMQNKDGFVYDNTGNIIIERKGFVSDSLVKKGRFMQQLTFADYLSR